MPHGRVPPFGCKPGWLLRLILHGATRCHQLGEHADGANRGLLLYLTAASRRCTKPSIAGASIQRTTATKSCSGST